MDPEIVGVVAGITIAIMLGGLALGFALYYKEQNRELSFQVVQLQKKVDGFTAENINNMLLEHREKMKKLEEMEREKEPKKERRQPYDNKSYEGVVPGWGLNNYSNKNVFDYDFVKQKSTGKNLFDDDYPLGESTQKYNPKDYGLPF